MLKVAAHVFGDSFIELHGIQPGRQSAPDPDGRQANGEIGHEGRTVLLGPSEDQERHHGVRDGYEETVDQGIECGGSNLRHFFHTPVVDEHEENIAEHPVDGKARRDGYSAQEAACVVGNFFKAGMVVAVVPVAESRFGKAASKLSI